MGREWELGEGCVKRPKGGVYGCMFGSSLALVHPNLDSHKPKISKLRIENQTKVPFSVRIVDPTFLYQVFRTLYSRAMCAQALRNLHGACK